MDPASQTANEQAAPAAEPWVGVSRYAALAFAVYAVVYQLFAGFSPPVTVIGLAFLGVGAFIRNGRRRLAFSAGMMAFLLVAASGAPLADALTDLASLEAFWLNLLLTLIAFVSFFAGIGAIRRSDGRYVRVVLGSAVGLFAVGLSLSAVVATGIKSAEPLTGDTRVVAESMSFNPEEIVVATDSGIWLENRDGVRHTFTVVGTDLDLNVPGNSAGRMDIALEPGTYQVICDVPGHQAMTLDLTVIGGSQ